MMNPMTVRTMIEILQKYNPNEQIFLGDGSNGFDIFRIALIRDLVKKEDMENLQKDGMSATALIIIPI